MKSFTPAFGWIHDSAAIQRYLAALSPVEDYAHLKRADDNRDVFFWEAEAQVCGKLLGSWDQGSIGSCEGHGGGRAAQDVFIIQIAQGSGEQWPGAQVCREAVYAGSREVGGMLGGGDGSTGGAVAEWVQKGGILFYLAYPEMDLTSGYTVARCGQWGRSGVPSALKPEAIQHPVQQVAPVTTTDGAWAVLGNLYGINISGNISRTMQRETGGYCPQTGNDWPHSQCLRGRCTVKGGRRAVVYQNSWGAYLGDTNATVELASGRTLTLPEGCYLSDLDEIAPDLRLGDSYAYSHALGFPAQSPHWYPWNS